MKKSATIGCFEQVGFPSLGVIDVVAKVDTGAFSGALHCTNIRVVRRGIKRTRILKFTPLGDKKLATETTDFQSTYVRSATGHRVRRHVITTNIVIQNVSYPITIGLSDRTDMKRPVLLGRRFLREQGMLVDVRINQEFDDEGENTK